MSKEKELLSSFCVLFLFIGIEYLVADDVPLLTLLPDCGILFAVEVLKFPDWMGSLALLFLLYISTKLPVLIPFKMT